MRAVYEVIPDLVLMMVLKRRSPQIVYLPRQQEICGSDDTSDGKRPHVDHSQVL
jgi:hypothetical protein